MDSPTFTLLIAAGGFAAGVVLCWLLMRGRSAASTTPQARPDAQGELAQAKGRIRQLEDERQAAVKNYDDLRHQTARARDLPDLRKKDTEPPPELIAQLTSLQAQVSLLQAQEIATHADTARARSEAQAEQAQAKEYFRSLEKNQQLIEANTQTLKREADELRDALDQARKDQAQAAQQAAQIPALEARLVALQNKEQANQQAALRGVQGNEESAESLKRAQARVAALEQENAMLKRTAAALPIASSQAFQAQPATTGPQDTQLPVLEKQVVALQDLEKAIKKEFLLLAELQRNVTLTSATRHEFIDSPESRTGASSSSAA